MFQQFFPCSRDAGKLNATPPRGHEGIRDYGDALSRCEYTP